MARGTGGVRCPALGRETLGVCHTSNPSPRGWHGSAAGGPVLESEITVPPLAGPCHPTRGTTEWGRALQAAFLQALNRIHEDSTG